jgi:UDP-N-acetylmuramyl tripeptide synthase
MKLELSDSRRLTGANLYWDHPSAIIDVAIEGPREQVIEAWVKSARELLDGVGYSEQETCFRTFDGGASLLISAPIDVLYSMCELNEVAWAGALHACGQGEAPDPVEVIPRLTRLFDEERNPPLLTLQATAHEKGAPFLWDDDEVSVGYGASAIIWPPEALPSPEEIDWDKVNSIPLALVTGTNGKSTTVRMTAAIMSASGRNAGLTSTDFIRVGNRTIDTGDYSGTGGARTLMRQPDVEMAVLEVARGGLLRRGLGVESADVAVVTNVAADHLGEYGINSVAELIPAKFIVHRAIGPQGTLVLNADDDGVAEFGARLGKKIAWYSLDANHPLVTEALAGGNQVCFLDEDKLVAASAGELRHVADVADIPATMRGIVRHNISNALAAMSTAIALEINDDAIRKGLSAFRGDESDNPGRGNWFEHRVDGGVIRILVDFAHNEHGMTALADTVQRLGAERTILLIGQAGDRLDKDIADLVKAACGMNPDQLLIAELPGYERGRKPFEVPQIIRKVARTCGISENCMEDFPGPREATAQALQRARAGDLLVLLALTQRQEALSLVHDFMGDDKAVHG